MKRKKKYTMNELREYYEELLKMKENEKFD